MLTVNLAGGIPLEPGLRHVQALEEVLSKSASGWSSYHTLLELRRVCRAAWQAMDDNCCREQLDLIELYAADLAEAEGRVRPGAGATRADMLYESIRSCLKAIRQRLDR